MTNQNENTSVIEKFAFVGALFGAGMTVYGHMNQTKNTSGTNAATKLGWTTTAASLATLGYTNNEKSTNSKMKKLLKERFDRLTEIDRQLKDIRDQLDQYQDWLNNENNK